VRCSCEDDKFESTVGRVLPKLLPLFLRPSAAIREHLVLICNHVNKRLNALPQLRLPAADLLQLYQAHGSDVANPNLAYFVTFVLMYIEKAFARCGVAERTRLAHQLLPGLALRTPQHQKSVRAGTRLRGLCNICNTPAINRCMLILLQ